MKTWTDREYADPVPYLRHRAELIVSLGPRLEAGARLLDLACGDGGLADFLPGIDYLGVDAHALASSLRTAVGLGALAESLGRERERAREREEQEEAESRVLIAARDATAPRARRRSGRSLTGSRA